VIIFAGAVAVLGEVYGDLLRAAGATERLMELLASRSPVASPERPVAAPATGGGSAVAFEGVSFHYPSRPLTPALKDFTLRVAPGETVALVGPSGAGKSTVFSLLLRFYDPATGGIAVDGVPVQQRDLQDLRSRIGLVAQEPVVFSTSALENIRYGRPEASDDEVVAAAKAAYAHEFITALPEGYGTFLGERGVRLSGGQRQRVAIARAILKNPPLAAAGRGHQRAGRRERTRGAGRAGVGDARPHDAGDRAPPGHRAEGRPHHRAGPRRHRRTGPPRRAGGGRRRVCAAGGAAVAALSMRSPARRCRRWRACRASVMLQQLRLSAPAPGPRPSCSQLAKGYSEAQLRRSPTTSRAEVRAEHAAALLPPGHTAAPASLGPSPAAPRPRRAAKARVVVVGGGYGGATAAKYVRLLSDHKIDVTCWSNRTTPSSPVRCPTWCSAAAASWPDHHAATPAWRARTA
jgi:ABC-type lipoprotein export system ATPase subunit